MTAADLATIAKATAPIVREVIDAKFAAVMDRLSAMETRLAAAESRPMIPGPQGERGEKGDTVHGEKGEPGERGRDGVDADPAVLEAVVKDVATLTESIAELRSVDVSAEIESRLAGAVEAAVKALPAPKDGADGARGADGTSVTVADVAPLVRDAVEVAVKALPVPKDGRGVADAFVDHDGHLIQTFTDGSTKDAGPVKGRDGSDGVNGKDGRDGEDGKHGRDGIAFSSDDLAAGEIDLDQRTGVFTVKQGVSFPIRIRGGMSPKGIWDERVAYEKGDVVTWAGSSWIAKDTTTGDKPGLSLDASRVWVLMVKRGGQGARGSDGGIGPKGEKGEKGDAGKW